MHQPCEQKRESGIYRIIWWRASSSERRFVARRAEEEREVVANVRFLSSSRCGVLGG